MTNEERAKRIAEIEAKHKQYPQPRDVMNGTFVTYADIDWLIEELRRRDALCDIVATENVWLRERMELVCQSFTDLVRSDYEVRKGEVSFADEGYRVAIAYLEGIKAMREAKEGNPK